MMTVKKSCAFPGSWSFLRRCAAIGSLHWNYNFWRIVFDFPCTYRIIKLCFLFCLDIQSTSSQDGCHLSGNIHSRTLWFSKLLPALGWFFFFFLLFCFNFSLLKTTLSAFQMCACCDLVPLVFERRRSHLIKRTRQQSEGSDASRCAPSMLQCSLQLLFCLKTEMLMLGIIHGGAARVRHYWQSKQQKLTRVVWTLMSCCSRLQK